MLLLVPALLLCLPWLNDAAHDLGNAYRQLVKATGAAAMAGISTMDSANPVLLATQLLDNPALHSAAMLMQQALLVLLLVPTGVYAVLAIAWHTAFESSAWQASPGKRALGLHVATLDGTRLSPLHAAWRQLASGASWFSLNLGHAMIGLHPRHLALHDLLGHARVLRSDGTPRLPAWARAWIAMQVALLLAGLAWLMVNVHQASDAMVRELLG